MMLLKPLSAVLTVLAVTIPMLASQAQAMGTLVISTEAGQETLLNASDPMIQEMTTTPLAAPELLAEEPGDEPDPDAEAEWDDVEDHTEDMDEDEVEEADE